MFCEDYGFVNISATKPLAELIPTIKTFYLSGNGRMYDPITARFLSADPFIPNPFSSQDYNRYSYVLNNPLKYTDPSGYTQINWNILSASDREAVTGMSASLAVATFASIKFPLGMYALGVSSGLLNFAVSADIFFDYVSNPNPTTQEHWYFYRDMGLFVIGLAVPYGALISSGLGVCIENGNFWQSYIFLLP